MIRTSYQKYKFLLFFLLFIVAIGFFAGLYYNYRLDNSLKNNIFDCFFDLIDRKKVLNANWYHLSIISFVPIFSYILIGPFFSVFALFYEGFSAGMMFSLFFGKKTLKGLVYVIIYTISAKLIFLALLLGMTIISFKIFKNILKKHKMQDYYLKMYAIFKCNIAFMLLATLNEILLVPILNRLCCYFSFLIL
ncbi:MAG: hypothetical protein IJA94_01130 [Bacilli bacterium]|nr:hypothetical protein [Bacilli bacterium]